MTERLAIRDVLCGGAAFVVLAGLLLSMGCKPDVAEQALETDANGYLCQGCGAKFYTERKVFADACPSCKSMKLAPVVGFVCAADGFMSVAPRGGGFLPCAKCRQTATGLAIPKASDLQAWGATKKNKAEVSGS